MVERKNNGINILMILASFAMRLSGNVKALVGSTPWSGSVWNTTEHFLKVGYP